MFRRTLGRLFGSFTTMGAVAVFASASSAAFFIELGKGGSSPVAALWAVAAVPWLQGLAVFATMRLLAEERLAGRMDLILTAPVRESSVVMGKFLGAWALSAMALMVYLAVPLLLLPRFAPSFAPMPRALSALISISPRQSSPHSPTTRSRFGPRAAMLQAALPAPPGEYRSATMGSG